MFKGTYFFLSGTQKQAFGNFRGVASLVWRILSACLSSLLIAFPVAGILKTSDSSKTCTLCSSAQTLVLVQVRPLNGFSNYMAQGQLNVTRYSSLLSNYTVLFISHVGQLLDGLGRSINKMIILRTSVLSHLISLIGLSI